MSTVPATPALDIFALRDSVIDEYKQFATSFTTIHASDIKTQVEAIYAEERYWPEPLIQINPSYKRTTDIKSLVAQGALDPTCADIFQTKGTPLSLYKHQEQAIALAEAGESYVVTTGTGSGKSLCFFIPIVHRVLVEKRKSAQARTRAIIIYPMNALANSQLEELGKFVGNVAGAPPITFARYTGQEDAEERKRIADNPPDILLTNFMMLELLMTRQDEVDRRVIQLVCWCAVSRGPVLCCRDCIGRPGRCQRHAMHPMTQARKLAGANVAVAAVVAWPAQHRHLQCLLTVAGVNPHSRTLSGALHQCAGR